MSKIDEGDNVEFNEKFKKWHKSTGALHRVFQKTLSEFCNYFHLFWRKDAKVICENKTKLTKFNFEYNKETYFMALPLNYVQPAGSVESNNFATNHTNTSIKETVPRQSSASEYYGWGNYSELIESFLDFFYGRVIIIFNDKGENYCLISCYNLKNDPVIIPEKFLIKKTTNRYVADTTPGFPDSFEQQFLRGKVAPPPGRRIFSQPGNKKKVVIPGAGSTAGSIAGSIGIKKRLSRKGRGNGRRKSSSKAKANGKSNSSNSRNRNSRRSTRKRKGNRSHKKKSSNRY